MGDLDLVNVSKTEVRLLIIEEKFFFAEFF